MAALTHRLVLTHSPAATVESAQSIGMAWLVRLRWAATAAQIALLLLATLVLGLHAALGLVLPIIAITTVTNAALHWRLYQRTSESRWLVAAVLVLDTLLLTGLLLATGGPSNPFSVFYLVHVALAAMLLNGRGTWVLAATTTVCFGVLFAWTPDDAHTHMQHDGFALHLRGMWLSYALAAAAIGYFITRVKKSLAEREARLAALDAMRGRSEQLVALSALAANAAHELGTPLGTIALVVKEIELASRAKLDAARVAEDAAVIRAEVERCRSILATMGDRSGEAQVGDEAQVSTAVVVRELATALGAARVQRLRVSGATPDISVRTQTRPLVQALANLVINALDASSEPVELVISRRGDEVCFIVADRGDGMAPEILQRIGEPFFTTKPASRGFGLGLFLVRTFAERMRARLEIVSAPGSGTRVELAMRGER